LPADGRLLCPGTFLQAGGLNDRLRATTEGVNTWGSEQGKRAVRLSLGYCTATRLLFRLHGGRQLAALRDRPPKVPINARLGTWPPGSRAARWRNADRNHGGTVRLTIKARPRSYMAAMPTARDPLYQRHRFPPEVISYAVWLYLWTVPAMQGLLRQSGNARLQLSIRSLTQRRC
jgi:hypothetical protein